MNTHATNLLTQLIDGLYNAKPTPELHAHQMLAAELKGAMAYEWTEQPPIDVKPTPDADGWVENTGVMPECEIKAVRFYHGGVNNTNDKAYSWEMKVSWLNDSNAPNEYIITHYKPA